MNRYLSLTLAIGAAGVLAAVGCEKNAQPTDDQLTVKESFDRTAEQAPADNTRRNIRERDEAHVTPLDQGENDVDRGITQKVRQAVVSIDGLSMNAKNVKIITNGGIVTLRGPVESTDESDRIMQIATSVADVKRVDNQLDVKKP
jgi:hyperosmotically inducible protein